MNVLSAKEENIKVSEVPNLISEIVYSSDSDCEYRIIRTIVKINKENSTGAIYNCNICSKQFRRETSLESHIKRHHGIGVWEKRFNKEHNNEVIVIPDENTIIDDPVNKIINESTTSNNENVIIIKSSHAKYQNGLDLISEVSKIEKCHKCQMSYLSTDVASHAKTCTEIHNPRKDHPIPEPQILIEKCHKCNKSYIAADIAEHARNCAFAQKSIVILSEIDEDVCRKCNETYKLTKIHEHAKVCKIIQHLRKPELSKEQTASVCPICGKLIQPRYLSYHMKTHGTKSFLCSMCGKSFISGTLLKLHYRTHTKDYTDECNICKKKFCNKYILVEHMRIHSGDKPYACKFCPKAFTHWNGIKQHMRCHGAPKKVACKFCDRAFFNNAEYRRHLRVHTGEKPYSCETCQIRFVDSKSMKRHIRRLHSKKEEEQVEQTSEEKHDT